MPRPAQGQKPEFIILSKGQTEMLLLFCEKNKKSMVLDISDCPVHPRADYTLQVQQDKCRNGWCVGFADFLVAYDLSLPYSSTLAWQIIFL